MKPATLNSRPKDEPDISSKSRQTNEYADSTAVKGQSSIEIVSSPTNFSEESTGDNDRPSVQLELPQTSTPEESIGTTDRSKIKIISSRRAKPSESTGAKSRSWIRRYPSRKYKPAESTGVKSQSRVKLGSSAKKKRSKTATGVRSQPTIQLDSRRNKRPRTTGIRSQPSINIKSSRTTRSAKSKAGTSPCSKVAITFLGVSCALFLLLSAGVVALYFYQQSACTQEKEKILDELGEAEIEVQGELQNTTEELNKFKTANKQLTTYVNDLQLEFQNITTTNEALSSELEAAKLRKEELQRLVQDCERVAVQNEQLANLLSESQQELELVNSAKDELSLELEEAKVEIEKLQNKSQVLDEIISEKQQLTNNVERLEQELQNMTAVLDGVISEKQQLTNYVEQLEKRLQNVTAAKDTLTDELRNAKSEIVELQNNLEACERDSSSDNVELANDIEELRQQLQNATAEKDNVLNELEDANSRITDLMDTTSDLPRVTSENARLTNDLADTQSDLQSVTDEKDRIAAELVTANSQVAVLQAATSEVTRLTSENQRLTNDLDDSQQDLLDMTNEKEDIEDDIETARVEVERLVNVTAGCYYPMVGCEGADVDDIPAEMRSGNGGQFETIIPGDEVGHVYCDVTTEGGEWTVFQRRMDGSVDFDLGWFDYVFGFGDLGTEFWLGLESIHQLTKNGDHELRIDMIDATTGAHYTAKYSIFKLGSREELYKLDVRGYSGNATDAFRSTVGSSIIQGKPFTTKDADHDDLSSGNCANLRGGGWWYYACAECNLNGVHGVSTDAGMGWEVGSAGRKLMTYSEMKVRKRL